MVFIVMLNARVFSWPLSSCEGGGAEGAWQNVVRMLDRIHFLL